MRAHPITFLSSICVAALAVSALVAGCGDDDSGVSGSDLDRACNTTCSKFSECDLLLGMSVDSCVSRCRGSASGGSSDCEVSSSEANACISAIDAAECSALSSGMTPPECDLCPSSTPPPTPPGSPDAGGGAGCSDLAGCCPQLAMDQQEGCNALVESGMDSTCGSALAGFRAASLCD